LSSAEAIVDEAWVRRYLRYLELDQAGQTVEGLNAIARSHSRVLFENLTSLLRRASTAEGPVPPLDPESVLTSWEQGKGGGVCYEIADMLQQLLSTLGFDAWCVMATLNFPANPGIARIGFARSHQAVLVAIDEGKHLVDVGNGAPTYTAVPLGELREIHVANLGYRFSLDDVQAEVIQERLVESGWRPFVKYELLPAEDSARETAYQKHHEVPARSFVMSNLRMVRCKPNWVASLLDHQLSIYGPVGRTSEEVFGLRRYREIVGDLFNAPNLPIDDGLRAWTAITGAKI
jgi:arylamine N-acetyltransferase